MANLFLLSHHVDWFTAEQLLHISDTTLQRWQAVFIDLVIRTLDSAGLFWILQIRVLIELLVIGSPDALHGWSIEELTSLLLHQSRNPTFWSRWVGAIDATYSLTRRPTINESLYVFHQLFLTI
jgi:hypothetical protein